MNSSSPSSDSKLTIYRASLASAIITGLLTVCLGAMAGYHAFANRSHDELTSPELTAMQADLRRNPQDAALAAKIRDLDFQLRQSYFRRQKQMQMAGPAAAVCGLLLVLSLNATIWARRRLPNPRGKSEVDTLAFSRKARFAVTTLGVFVISSAAALAVAYKNWTPPAPEPPDPFALAAPAPDSEMAMNWPRFRGPGGLGVAPSTMHPTDWGAPSSMRVLWKSQIPLGGDGSPIVWQNKVFVTGADPFVREVYCFDADSGKMLWRKKVENVPGSSNLSTEAPEAGFAASTPCTDGRRVFAVFPNMDLVALSVSGREIWKKNLGVLKLDYGYASSLLTVGGKLIVQLDQDNSTSSKSVLLAFDSLTGEKVWEAKRPVSMSWTTPIVVDTPTGKQIVTAGKPFVIAYDPADGHELWRANVLEGEVAPSPAFGAGLVFTANADAKLAAMKTDGRGDVTETHVAWSSRREDEIDMPEIPSPVSDGKKVWILKSTGMLTCLDASGDGAGNAKKLYDQALKMGIKSSPTIVSDTLVLLSDSGTMLFVSLGDEYKLLGKAAIGESTTCSPAFVGSRIYIRGKKNLICIGSPR